MNDIGAIVLAAGASTRMKKQKMLLPYGGETIIERVIKNIKSVKEFNIHVVLGSHYEEITKKISNLQVDICINENYQEGMLSSVICGLSAVSEDVKAVLIFLGDQPQIPPEVNRKVIAAWRKSEKGIVIPIFEGRRGHPTLIETRYRDEIKNLDNNQGLRQLMRIFQEDVFEVECGRNEILRDIDTPEDYQNEISLGTKKYNL